MSPRLSKLARQHPCNQTCTLKTEFKEKIQAEPLICCYTRDVCLICSFTDSSLCVITWSRSRCFRQTKKKEKKCKCYIFYKSEFVPSPRGTADWFGVSKDSDTTQRWRRKSLQHCSHLYGGLKAQVMREMELHSQDNLSLASTETPPPLYLPPLHPSHHHYGMQRVGLRQRGGTSEGWRNKMGTFFSFITFSPPFFPPFLHFTCDYWACFNTWLCQLSQG